MPTRDELARLSDAADPGDWFASDSLGAGCSSIGRSIGSGTLGVATVYGASNAAFIVALVNAFRAGELAAAEPSVVPAHDHRGNTPEGERIECPYPGCDIGHPRTKEESIAFRKAWDKRLAAPGVAVPEPDQQGGPNVYS